MKAFASAATLVGADQPQRPVIGVRPHAAEKAAKWFLNHFPGTPLYAVKANDNPIVVDALYKAGIRSFDVTSLGEIEKYTHLEGRQLFCMHPIKSRDLIRRAYFDYGVRNFSLDCESELLKIVEETGRARDLNLHVRIAVPNEHSVIPLDRKFGIEPHLAPALIRQTRQVASGLGVSFHVGSQALYPHNYARAIALITEVIETASMPLEFFDVGGGFPVMHPGSEPPPLMDYAREVKNCLVAHRLDGYQILSEPGRALVAESESLIVQVWARKDHALYISDGTYGCLFEGAKIYGGLSYPVVRIRDEREVGGRLEAFTLWGPSCDSIDYLPGPFFLPHDTHEGDYIEIGLTGAYGRVSASNFNGFGHYDEVILEDEPIRSMYDDEEASAVMNF